MNDNIETKVAVHEQRIKALEDDHKDLDRSVFGNGLEKRIRELELGMKGLLIKLSVIQIVAVAIIVAAINWAFGNYQAGMTVQRRTVVETEIQKSAEPPKRPLAEEE